MFGNLWLVCLCLSFYGTEARIWAWMLNMPHSPPKEGAKALRQSTPVAKPVTVRCLKVAMIILFELTKSFDICRKGMRATWPFCLKLGLEFQAKFAMISFFSSGCMWPRQSLWKGFLMWSPLWPLCASKRGGSLLSERCTMCSWT